MTRRFLPVALFVNLMLVFLADGAVAGPGNSAGDAQLTVKGLSHVERTQYYAFGNNDYCWYDDGWQGPGWYLCGDEWSNGFGWGGPYGWNGWGGGYLIRRHGSHGIGVWHQGQPNHFYGGGAPAHGLKSWPVPRPP